MYDNGGKSRTELFYADVLPDILFLDMQPSAMCGVKEVILIGENFPVNKFNAQIIAVAHDKTGAKDDILIAAKENSIFYEPNIAKMTERFLQTENTEFVCYYEKSAVPYCSPMTAERENIFS